jgi:hypothetical protein
MGAQIVETLAIEFTDYALAASYMMALAVSLTATMMVRSATFPLSATEYHRLVDPSAR